MLHSGKCCRTNTGMVIRLSPVARLVSQYLAYTVDKAAMYKWLFELTGNSVECINGELQLHAPLSPAGTTRVRVSVVSMYL
jgi:hypothetical protein